MDLRPNRFPATRRSFVWHSILRRLRQGPGVYAFWTSVALGLNLSTFGGRSFRFATGSSSSEWM